MKIVKTVVQKIEEEIPFDWEELEQRLDNWDYFNPEDDEDWNWFVDDVSDQFTKEELEANKDKIIKFEKEKYKESVSDDLEYYLNDALEKLVYSNSYITEEDVISYVKSWIEKNKDEFNFRKV